MFSLNLGSRINLYLEKLIYLSCTGDADPWSAESQPSYVSEVHNLSYGKCLGYTNVPGGVQCSGRFRSHFSNVYLKLLVIQM